MRWRGFYEAKLNKFIRRKKDGLFDGDGSGIVTGETSVAVSLETAVWNDAYKVFCFEKA